MQLDPRILANFQARCPLTYKALCGRRYLLPQKHQASYANQDHGLERRVLVLLESVLTADKDSFAHKAELICLLVGLRYDLPTLFLDEDLGFALDRTTLPGDFRTEDCRFLWPSFRLMMPLSLDLDNGDGEARRKLCYVDIALCGQGERITLDEQFLTELQVLGDANILRRGFVHPEAPTVYFSGLTDGKETMTFSHQWKDEPLQELAKVDDDRPGEKQVHRLLFNVLLLLSQHRSTITLPPLEVVRLAKMEGAHLRPGLTKARFVSDLVEPQIVRQRRLRDPDEEAQHRYQRQCWRRGHWHNIVIGKGRLGRRLTWLKPYQTHGPPKTV